MANLLDANRLATSSAAPVLLMESGAEPVELFTRSETISLSNRRRWNWHSWDDLSKIHMPGDSHGWPVWAQIATAFLIATQRLAGRDEIELPTIMIRQDGEGTPTGKTATSLHSGSPSRATFSALTKYLCEALQVRNRSLNQEVRKSQIFLLLCDRPIGVRTRTYLEKILGDRDCLLALVLDRKTGSCAWTGVDAESVRSKADRIKRHSLTLLRRVKDGLESPIGEIDVLDNSDRKLLYTYGTGKQVVRQFSPYINVISAHAEAQPQRIAVSCEGQSLTYGALWTCSGALAGALSRLGIGRGSRVALYMPPSLDIPIAILALHRLGAVYVPIDPEFPKGRVEAILEAVAPELVLTRGTLHSIPESYLGLSRELCDIEATPDNLESLEIHPSDESHIFFTSGTTGRPKGIVATHENLAHYIWSAIHEYRFSSSDRFIAAARYTFSISLFELLVPLVSGGSVNILPRNRVLDLAYLASAVESATVFHFGPGLLKVFLPYICRNFGDTNRFSGVRHASSGGDMIPPEILEKLKYCFREADVYVIYGASEISCMGCTYEVPKERVVQQTRVGRPFENTSIRVLDQDGKSVLPGVVGTIHFSGPGLVKGYLDNPALTAERFYSHEGKRWYSIGDIGRIDEQGNLQLLGREDFQINVCGMRVETLEIESLLKKHKVVSDCVVHGRRDSEDSETTIVAYVVPRSGGEVKKADLNGYLSDLLPEYMLPHAYVAMEKLPLNHNGKLDRGQLPVPCAEDSSLPECNFDLTPTQLTLVRIWEGLLCTKGIGIEHNFFKLGGDSIRAVNLLAQIDKEFRVAIPIASLVGHATIKDLAAIIDGEVRLPEVNNVVVLKDGDNRKPPLFCLCGVLTYKDLAESLDIDNMVCAISEDLAGLDLSAEVESAMRSGSRRQLLDSIINHYLQVIRQYQARGPYYLCGLSLGGFIAMEVARKMEAMGEQVCLLAMFDTWSPGFLDRLTTRQRISAHFRKLLREGPAYVYRRILARFKRVITRGFFAKPEAERPGGAYLGMIGRRLIIDDYPLRPIDRKILFFRAEERADFEPQNMPDLGWSEYASDLDITAISGDHYGIMKSGQVEAIAKIMSERIRASETANAASTVLAG